MEAISLIPHYQALPFPAPVWLLQLLLVLGFFLHAIPMNLALGGCLSASVCLFLGRNDKESYVNRIGKSLAAALPLFISFAITQGIVPLLFVQLLYGPMFYTSSILIAAPWFSIIFLLLIAYYSSYLVIYRFLKNKEQSLAAPAILFLAALIFMVIAYLFTGNMILMLTPEKWMQIYQHNNQGMNLPSSPQLAPRMLHTLIASIAVTGLALGCFGLYAKKKDPDYGSWLVKKGSQVFLLLSVLQIPVGLWFLFSLPKEIMTKFMGGDLYGTIAFASSMTLALVAVICTAISSTSGSSGAFKGGLVSGVLTVLSMVVTRHELRSYYLKPFISPDIVPVKTQWDLLSIFVLSALALIVYLVWLAKLVWKAYEDNPPAPGPAVLDTTSV